MVDAKMLKFSPAFQEKCGFFLRNGKKWRITDMRIFFCMKKLTKKRIHATFSFRYKIKGIKHESSKT